MKKFFTLNNLAAFLIYVGAFIIVNNILLFFPFFGVSFRAGFSAVFALRTMDILKDQFDI